MPNFRPLHLVLGVSGLGLRGLYVWFWGLGFTLNLELLSLSCSGFFGWELRALSKISGVVYPLLLDLWPKTGPSPLKLHTFGVCF